MCLSFALSQGMLHNERGLPHKVRGARTHAARRLDAAVAAAARRAAWRALADVCARQGATLACPTWPYRTRGSCWEGLVHRPP